MFRLPTPVTTYQHTASPSTPTRKKPDHLPQIIQSSSPCPLHPPLHNFNAFDIGTIYLKPHLDADARQLVAQQDAGINAAAADVHTDARERVAVPQPYEQDVADFGGLGVGAREELGAGAGGV